MLVALEPPDVVTMTSTVPAACGGDTTVIDVDELTVTLVAGASPNLTVAGELKFVPVTVTVAAPVVAVLDAARVSVLVLVVQVGLNVAVTPVGNPVAANATLPVNPPDGVTVNVLVPLAP